MKDTRKELLDFAEKNPRFVLKAIMEATNGEDFSDYSTEEVIQEQLSDEIVDRLVKRFKIINEDKINV